MLTSPLLAYSNSSPLQFGEGLGVRLSENHAWFNIRIYLWTSLPDFELNRS